MSPVVGLMLRLLHALLHAVVLALVCLAFFRLPETKEGTTKTRAMAWLAFEATYAFLSLSILIYSICAVALAKHPPKCLALIQSSRIFKHSTDLNFFYYAIMSVFVCYSTMIGCHLPALFYRLSGLGYRPRQSWQPLMLSAIVISGTNAMLYLIAAFTPLGTGSSSDPAQENEQDSLSTTSIVGDLGKEPEPSLISFAGAKMEMELKEAQSSEMKVVK